MKTRALRYFVEAYSDGDDQIGNLKLAIPKKAYKSTWELRQALPALIEQWHPTRIEVVRR